MLGQYRERPTCYKKFLKTLDALPRTEGISEEVYNVMFWLLEVDPKDRLSPKDAYRILSRIEVSEPNPFSTHSSSRPKGDSPLSN